MPTIHIGDTHALGEPDDEESPAPHVVIQYLDQVHSTLWINKQRLYSDKIKNNNFLLCEFVSIQRSLKLFSMKKISMFISLKLQFEHL